MTAKQRVEVELVELKTKLESLSKLLHVENKTYLFKEYDTYTQEKHCDEILDGINKTFGSFDSFDSLENYKTAITKIINYLNNKIRYNNSVSIAAKKIEYIHEASVEAIYVAVEKLKIFNIKEDDKKFFIIGNYLLWFNENKEIVLNVLYPKELHDAQNFIETNEIIINF